jgi:hypothetical protein
VTCLEWRVPSDMQEQVFEYYTETVVPLIMNSPEVLRLRIFEVDHAIKQRGQDFGVMEKEKIHTFLTVVEMESEEWPWEVVMELAEDDKWSKYFEKQDVVVGRYLFLAVNERKLTVLQKWNISTFLVKRVYTEEDKPRSAG